MNRPAPDFRSRAFTLIELLTVIAIVGVLAGILIPAVGGLRKKALRTESVNNLRQVFSSINLYASDNKGLLPNGYLAKNSESGRGYSNWWEVMAASGHLGGHDQYNRDDPNSHHNFTVLGSATQRYYASDLMAELSKPKYTTFSMNGALNSSTGSQKKITYLNFAHFINPSETMLVTEGTTNGKDWFQTIIWPAGTPDYVGDDIAMLYADGHVAVIPAEEFPTADGLSGSDREHPDWMFWYGTESAARR